MNINKLNDVFEYKEGVLYWKNPISSRTQKGQKAGTLSCRGYFQTCVNKKIILNHRIIFAMHYGYFPKIVDHIDGNKQNNTIENLREATHQENSRNQKISKTNTSGYKNVRQCKKTKKWVVELWVNKHPKYIGTYKDLELADLVATMAREKYHGAFARHV